MDDSDFSWTDMGSEEEEYDDDEIADHLLKEGYVVIPLLEDLPSHVSRFDLALSNLREYRTDLGRSDRQFAKTGFGGLATPSSYHNECVRYLRIIAYKRVVPVLASYDSKQKYGFTGSEERPWDASSRVERPRSKNGVLKPRRVHEIVDRMATRVVGQQPSSESWHRDVSYTGFGDAVTTFGGWIALTDQTASLVPRTHESLPGPVGFSGIDKSKHSEMRRRSVTVPIPAGSILVMHQNIVHEVVSSKHSSPDPMRRLFVGWRLTYSKVPLCEHFVPRTGYNTRMGARRDGPAFSQDLDKCLTLQEGFKLPSDQFPDVYNEKGLDMPAQQPGLRSWITKYIHPSLFERILASDGSEKFRGGAPLRHMLPVPHVQEGLSRDAMNVYTVCRLTGRNPYPPYGEEERRILFPIPIREALSLSVSLDESKMMMAAGR